MKIYANYHTKDLSITYYILSGIKSKTCNRGEMEDGRRGIWMGILSFTEHGGKGKRVENPLITFNNIFIIHFLWGNKINQPSKNFKGD